MLHHVQRPSRVAPARNRTSRRRPAAAPSPRFLHRPILGGDFGLSGRYLLATTSRVVNGLHAVSCMVLDAQAGTVLALADRRADALQVARRAVRATQIAERRAALVAAQEAGQGELFPVDRPARRRRPSRRRRQVFEASGGRCFYCSVPLELAGPWHADHMLPRALDGGDEAPNLVAACPQCNLAKGDRTAVEFVADAGRGP